MVQSMVGINKELKALRRALAPILRQLNDALQVTLRKVRVLLRHCTAIISCKCLKSMSADLG